MGIMDRITGILRRKKEEPVIEPMPELPSIDISAESVSSENVKARVDLLLTQIDSLRMQYQAMNERIIQIERMVKELYDMAKSS